MCVEGRSERMSASMGPAVSSCAALILMLGCAVYADPAASEPGLLTRTGNELMIDGKPFRAVGVNKFDLLRQFVMGGEEREKAERAIEQIAAAGFRVVRIAGCMFYPKEMNAWAGEDYWKRIDDMFAALRKAGLKAIPCLVWNTYLFPDIAHETLREMLTNRDSKSRQYVDFYISQFVERYKNEPSVLFWELWSELNLGADLESARPYGFYHLNVPAEGAPPVRVRTDNYSTDQMIPFLRELAQLVRSIDPKHLISSGHSIPRPSAQHLRLAGTKGDWTMDSPAEAGIYLRDIHPDPIDIISIHIYNFYDDNIRFGNTDKDSAVILRQFKQMADRVGKPIIIGEAGGQAFDDPNGGVPKFSRSVIDEAVAADYPLIIWWMASVGDELRFELNKTPQLNRLLLDAERRLKARAATRREKTEGKP